jgi:hypothetical protein
MVAAGSPALVPLCRRGEAPVAALGRHQAPLDVGLVTPERARRPGLQGDLEAFPFFSACAFSASSPICLICRLSCPISMARRRSIGFSSNAR